MAITSYPFENQDTNETQYSRLFRELQDSGVVDSVTGTGFKVTADATGMNVKIQPGRAIVRGHVVDNDAVYTADIAVANTQPRIDRVVLRLDPVANSILPVVLVGTPSTTPAAPALTQTDTGVYELLLANVAVAANAPNIAAVNVTDLRSYVSSRVGAWFTATRPTAPRKGTLGRNNDTGLWEEYDGAIWTPPKNDLIVPSGTGRVLHAHWGSGTSFPTLAMGVKVGDTYEYIGNACIQAFDGTGWRQVERAEVADTAARNAIPTNRIYSGFEVYQLDQKAIWTWDGTQWVYTRYLGVTRTSPGSIFPQMWLRWDNPVIANNVATDFVNWSAIGQPSAAASELFTYNNVAGGGIQCNKAGMVTVKAYTASDFGSAGMSLVRINYNGATATEGMWSYLTDVRQRSTGYTLAGYLVQDPVDTVHVRPGDSFGLRIQQVNSASSGITYGATYLSVTYN